jgi:UDP-N-acetylmuramoyl-tripeptide--D-alanyl-D-alanine ligase
MSARFTAGEARDWCDGDLHGDASFGFEGVSIDTRTLTKGALFVAVRGPVHDAHDYLDQALEAGAAGLLVERGRATPADAPLWLAVDDSTRALGALAAGHRQGFDGPLVAITGSNGKTTTKEMCAAILELLGPCLRNRGNLNNEYGLPLTLLERTPEHVTAVVEVGMNHRGEIAPLAAIARPGVAVITNVGTAHIEHLGSQEEIAAEKGDLLAALPEDGVAVVNADDPRALGQAARTHARVVLFGLAADADVRAEDVASLGAEGYRFTLHTPQGSCPIQVAGLGDTTIPNALAAAAAAQSAGAGLEQVAEGLAAYRPIRGRMESRILPDGLHVIDDSYNANPQSMEAALRSLAQLKGARRAVAVLGDMGELGAEARRAHRGAGMQAARLGIDFVVALGEHAGDVAAGARDEGLAVDRIHVEDSHQAAGRRVRKLVGADDWVLVKGSRSMQMERVVRALEAEAP